MHQHEHFYEFFLFYFIFIAKEPILPEAKKIFQKIESEESINLSKTSKPPVAQERPISNISTRSSINSSNSGSKPRSFYDYQPRKTQTDVVTLPLSPTIVDEINQENRSRQSSTSDPSYSSGKKADRGYYDLSTGQRSNLLATDIKQDSELTNAKPTNEPLEPYDPMLIKPEVIKMDTYAITMWNSSDENSEDDSTSNTDTYYNVNNFRKFQ